MAGRGSWRFVLAAVYIVWALLFVDSTRVRTPDGGVWPCLFDDAMISMRYARNLADGNGLVFNPGERVQGFSNPLTTLGMAGLISVFGPTLAVLMVQLLGIPTVLGCAFLADRIARDLDSLGPQAAGFAYVATLAYYPLSYWTLMGMETGLLTLLLLGSIAALQGRLWSLLGVLLGAAYLTRPDALLPAAVLLACAWRTGAPARAILRSGLIVAGFVLAVGLSQKLYYGSWLPNTYALKVAGTPLIARLANGIAFSTPLLVDSIPLLALAVTGYRAASSLGPGLLGLCGVAAGYQIYVGGDSWPGYWRFTTPFWPIAASLAARSPVLAHGQVRGRSVRWLLGGVMLLAGNARYLPEILLRETPFGVEANKENVRVAHALRRVTTQSATVGSPWAGAIPYYSERRAIDFLGKSDRRIAGLPPDLSGAVGWGGLTSVPGHNKYDLAYSIGERRPDYVQMFRWGAQAADSSEYVTVWYGRFLLRLRRGSPNIRWALLRCGPGECRAINPWR